MGGEAQGRIRVTGRGRPQTCPYCSEGLEGVLAYCGRCGARYHSDCWTENRGCGSLGCGMRAAPLRGTAPTRRAPPRPHDWVIDPDAPLPEPLAPPPTGRPPPPRPSPAVWAATGRAPPTLLDRIGRALMWLTVVTHSLISGLVTFLALGVFRWQDVPQGAQPWLVGGAFLAWLVLSLHVDERFGFRGRNDPRSTVAMLVLLIPFSGALYWLLWGWEEL